jgi:hypothetical protein
MGAATYGAWGFAVGDAIGTTMSFAADAISLTSDVAILREDGSGQCAAQTLNDQNQLLEDISGTTIDVGTFGVGRFSRLRKSPEIKYLLDRITDLQRIKAAGDLLGG